MELNENWTQKLLDSTKAVLKRTFIAGIANIRKKKNKSFKIMFTLLPYENRKKKHKLIPK